MTNHVQKKALIVAGILFFCLLLIGAFIFSKNNYRQSFPRVAKTPKIATYVPGQLVIKYKEGYNLSQISDPVIVQKVEAAFAQIGVVSQQKVFQSKDKNLSGYYLLKLKPGVRVIHAQEQLVKMDIIENATPNYNLDLQVTPNDPLYQVYQWNLKKINMPDAWGVAHASSKVIVAVLDSGIDYTQEDLPGNIIRGNNYATNTSDSTDTFGHGTFVAGIIAALTNNNKGVSSIADGIQLMGVKVTDENKGTALTMVQGFVDAVNGGAKVINLSIGATKRCSEIPILDEAFSYAAAQGVVIVASAGNDNLDAANVIPASCNHIITVGGTMQGDERAPFSNWGGPVVISAPAVDIISTNSKQNKLAAAFSCPVISSNYSICPGTSFSAPQVSAAAALLLSVNPSLTPDDIKNCLVQSGDPITTDKPIGTRLNVYKALLTCGHVTPVPSTITPTQTATLSGTIIPTPSSTLSATPVPTAPPGCSYQPINCPQICNTTLCPTCPPAQLICDTPTPVGSSSATPTPSITSLTPTPTSSNSARCSAANGNVGSCDQIGSCSYYFCSQQCWPPGTPLDVACPPRSETFCKAFDNSVNACDSAGNCSYYFCTSSCWPTGTDVAGVCTHEIVHGTAFIDYNKNGIQDSTDPSFSGGAVALSGQATTTQKTDAEGSYTFSELKAGTYRVQLHIGNKTIQSSPVILDQTIFNTTVNLPIDPVILQTTANSALNATISIPKTKIGVNEPITITAQAKGRNISKIGIYRAHPGSYTDYQSNWNLNVIAQKDCNNQDSCSVPGTWTPKEPGDIGTWYVIVQAVTSDGIQCTGNPLVNDGFIGPEPGEKIWYRCNDKKDSGEIEVLAPAQKAGKASVTPSKSGPTPTPTPVLYKCGEDPTCSKLQKSLNLCRLKCCRIDNLSICK